MKVSKHVSDLFGGVKVYVIGETNRPDLTALSKAVKLKNMLDSLAIEVLAVTIVSNEHTNIWITFPNGMELAVRSHEENRRKTYNNILGFGSKNGWKHEATKVASNLLEKEPYFDHSPVIKQTEQKGGVVFDYTISTKNIKILLAVVTALEKAEETTTR
jgi:hypothetical protein